VDLEDLVAARRIALDVNGLRGRRTEPQRNPFGVADVLNAGRDLEPPAKLTVKKPSSLSE
jgi:hypothetical protein